MNLEFASIPLLALVERDSRHKYSLQKELRRHEPRSIFPPKPPFRPLFGAFYPHPAYKSALRAEEPPTLWHPGNLVGPQRHWGVRRGAWSMERETWGVRRGASCAISPVFAFTDN